MKWGFGIPDSATRHQLFKLDLNTAPHNDISVLSQAFPDPKAASTEAGRDAEKLTVDYLTALRLHVLEALQIKLGKALMDSTPVALIITVPAIWTDAAKQNTRRCAELAGMGTDLKMISEPEAAVLYTMDAMNPENLAIGDVYVVCDAGGGTVDLISYHVDNVSPRLQVSEAAPGSGHTCGSIFVSRMFRKWLQKTFSSNPGWGDDSAQEASSMFDQFVKREFDGSDKSYLISVPGLVDDRATGVKRGKISISGSSIEEIFLPVVTTVCELVKSQIKTTVRPVKAVLLVGGFGQSPYPRKQVASIVDKPIEVLQPAHGWTAVVRGALLHGLAEACENGLRTKIGYRVARYAIGYELTEDFEAGEDPEEHKSVAMKL